VSPAYLPWGYGPPYLFESPVGGYLRGMADLTAATGQYWQDIQRARLLREQSRQAALETRRRRMELELEYERLRPTALTLRAAEQAADLEWARRLAAPADIWSGRALNTLLQSILAAPRASGRSLIPLDAEVLRGINLNTGTTRGSLGLLKEGGKLAWPLPLLAATFDEARKRFDNNVQQVARGLETGEGPTPAQLRELNADFSTLSDLLLGQVRDLSPTEYIGSRRFLNRLRQTLQALADPALVRAAATRLPSSVTTVTDLVDHLRRNGLRFAPAVAPGDEPAYMALYFALREYEAMIVPGAQIRASGG
jgi:hypothetical protein